MTVTTVTQEQQQFLKQMIERCQSDAAFRRQLIADPEAVFSFMGLEYSEQLIEQCRNGTLDLVLASNKPLNDKNLDDKDLDDQGRQQISGGVDPMDTRISEHEMEYLSRLLISERDHS